jgi:hypothetical protein
MKKIIFISSILTAFIFFSCNPQFDKAPDIGNPPSDEISVSKIDNNHYIVSAKTDNGFLFNWNFGNGQTSTKKTDTVYFPFKGNFNITLIISGKGGTSTATTTINVPSNDPSIANSPGIKELTNNGAGQIWVYATGNPNDNHCFYMTARYDWQEYWWDPMNDDQDTNSGFFNEIKFDVNGNYNFTWYQDSTHKDSIRGTFILNLADSTLKIVDSHMPDNDNENLNPDRPQPNLYQLKILNDHEFLIWQIQYNTGDDDNDYGWAWRFKRKGYVYSHR